MFAQLFEEEFRDLEILHDRSLLSRHGITLSVGYDSLKFWEMQYLDTKLVSCRTYT